MPPCRQLWSQPLSSYREVAATALTVKSAAGLADDLEKLCQLEASTVAAASAEEMLRHSKAILKFSNIHDIIRQLGGLGTSEVDGAADAYSKLVEARNKTICWLDALCDNFDDALAELSKWAEGVIQLEIENADCKACADACPTDPLRLPDRVSNTFLLRCPSVGVAAGLCMPRFLKGLC